MLNSVDIVLVVLGFDAVFIEYKNIQRMTWASTSVSEVEFVSDKVLEKLDRSMSLLECSVLCAYNAECYAFDNRHNACTLYTL